jgi:hypothetical protein
MLQKLQLLLQELHIPAELTADVREQGAEWSFCVGGRFGWCHRNDTNTTDCSAAATAV